MSRSQNQHRFRPSETQYTKDHSKQSNTTCTHSNNKNKRKTERPFCLSLCFFSFSLPSILTKTFFTFSLLLFYIQIERRKKKERQSPTIYSSKKENLNHFFYEHASCNTNEQTTKSQKNHTYTKPNFEQRTSLSVNNKKNDGKHVNGIKMKISLIQ